jgi:hypothetical protein
LRRPQRQIFPQAVISLENVFSSLITVNIILPVYRKKQPPKQKFLSAEKPVIYSIFRCFMVKTPLSGMASASVPAFNRIACQGKVWHNLKVLFMTLSGIKTLISSLLKKVRPAHRDVPDGQVNFLSRADRANVIGGVHILSVDSYLEVAVVAGSVARSANRSD